MIAQSAPPVSPSVVEALDEPWRRETELVFGRKLDVRAPHVLVGVEDVDVLRAGLVGLACDRARERRVLEQRVDAERLARLQIQADLHRQACVLLESLVVQARRRTIAGRCRPPVRCPVDCRAVKPLACLVAVVALVAACGGGGTKLATRDKTRACLIAQNVRLGGPLDFVATTATGGALRAHLADNDMTIVFGATLADADNIRPGLSPVPCPERRHRRRAAAAGERR